MLALLRRWADGAAMARVGELETLLAAERSKNRVLQAEVENLSAVVARDRTRVQAETARYARRAAGGQ